ncbi:hypothetical protein DWZ54_10090 [Mitsuokella sp. AF33-22]|nr:hypothetical protein DWZ54_10090 [Mitsuokella sp. AF33-22]
MRAVGTKALTGVPKAFPSGEGGSRRLTDEVKEAAYGLDVNRRRKALRDVKDGDEGATLREVGWLKGFFPF